MEKSVKNAVFKGFPVLMESDTVGSKQGQTAYLPSLFSTDSQLSSKIKTNFQSNFFRGFYLVAKCMNKRGADPSAIGLPMTFTRSIYQLFEIRICVYQVTPRQYAHM